MSDGIRLLLLADSHLGFDLPVRPRVARRRRGHDFLANYAAALEPALRGEVDLVVHGGDVFDRPGVPAALAYQAFEPLARVAARGVPVFVVPGNHERGRLPRVALAVHPRLHVFDRPRTFVTEIRGTTLALSGFPYERRSVRTEFPRLLEAAGWRLAGAALRLVCMHQCAEGATVGPGNFKFRSAADVVRLGDVPPAFAAVLSGHIHRPQVLSTDLGGRRLAGPVLYPGSIERTSVAEMDEPKGFMVVHLSPGDADSRVRWEFRRLPARPMIVEELHAERMTAATLEAAVSAIIAAAPADAVLRIRLRGAVSDAALRAVSAARLRVLAPESMNVEVQAAEWQRARSARGHSRRPPGRSPQAAANLSLPLPAPAPLPFPAPTIDPQQVSITFEPGPNAAATLAREGD